MNLPIQDTGLAEDLAIIVAHDDPIQVRLFKNNITPTVANVLGDFTEADFTGYASQPLVYSGAPVHDVANHVWYQPCTTLTWTVGVIGTGNLIYGVYLVDNAGRLRGAGRLDGAPAPMNIAGLTLSVTLNRRMSSEFVSS